MRVIAIVIAAVLVCAGCVSYRASQVTAITGAAALVTGIAIAATDSGNEETDGHAIDTRELWGGLLLIGGIVFALSGVVGMVAWGRPASSAKP